MINRLENCYKGNIGLKIIN